MYQTIRPLLFKLSPEMSHDLTLDWLGALQRLRLTSLITESVPDSPSTLLGLSFRNRVGLAAGLDKNGAYLNAMGALGFGHIEVGTVTPRPQGGNPAPRLFRLPARQALINRMGFNNLGVKVMVSNLQRRDYDGVLGVNIGKNRDTPVEQAADDYLACLRAVYPYADYVTLNLSSPNTPGLRDLQFGDALRKLLSQVLSTRDALIRRNGRHVPLLVKIAPDMSATETREVATILADVGVEGVIATNTTLDRSAVQGEPFADEAGGLSGAPLMSAATESLRILRDTMPANIPLIGVGGITKGEDAATKVEAGANLVQLYTGLIYQGPNLIRAAQTSIMGVAGQSSGHQSGH